MENKTSKYFKYAIGEIILVVIGILIAIQLNSLYSSREVKSQNKLIVKRMLSEVENNIERLIYLDTSGQSFSRAYNLPSFKQSEANLDASNKIISNGITVNDIDFLISNSAYNFSSLSTFRSVYDEMLNTGKIYTLKSDSLTTIIDTYYKRLERESYYVNMQLAETQTSLENCKHGWSYFKRAYEVDKINAIKNNPWLFDNNAIEYKNYSNFIYKARTVTIRTRDRISGLIVQSKDLAKALKQYLND